MQGIRWHPELAVAPDMTPHAARGRNGPAEFLSTHPLRPTRIQQIEVWMPAAKQYYRPR